MVSLGLNRRASSRPTKMKPCATGYVAVPTHDHSLQYLEQPQPRRFNPHIIVKMANRGYDVVVDVDTEVRQSQYLLPLLNLTLLRAT